MSPSATNSEETVKNLFQEVLEDHFKVHQQTTIMGLICWDSFWTSFLRPLHPVHLEVYCNTKFHPDASCHTSLPSERTSQHHHSSGRTSQHYCSSEFTPDLSEGKNASPPLSESE